MVAHYKLCFLHMKIYYGSDKLFLKFVHEIRTRLEKQDGREFDMDVLNSDSDYIPDHLRANFAIDNEKQVLDALDDLSLIYQRVAVMGSTITPANTENLAPADYHIAEGW